MGARTKHTTDVSVLINQLPARRIRELMGEIKISSREMAEYLGCAPQAVNQYKQGTSNPTYEKLLRIAERLNTTTDYLLGAEDCINHDNQRIHVSLGLSDASIRKLIALYKTRLSYTAEPYGPFVTKAIGAMLEYEEGLELLNLIHRYLFIRNDPKYIKIEGLAEEELPTFLKFMEQTSLSKIANQLSSLKERMEKQDVNPEDSE